MKMGRSGGRLSSSVGRSELLAFLESLIHSLWVSLTSAHTGNYMGDLLMELLERYGLTELVSLARPPLDILANINV